MTPAPNVKLLPPRRQEKILRRPRLLDMLHNNIHRKVLFVCAPAGYGKTTLLVDFAEDVDARVYWFRIASGDNSLAAFYDNVIQAFQLHHPEFGNDLALSVEQGMPSAEELANRLANQLEETLQDFSIFVLDDYHLVSADTEISDFVEAFISYLPDQLRLLIGSRNVYGIPTALLYVQEQMAIISEDDLKFQAGEIAELCWKYYHVQLTTEQTELILRQAEGWIVAILLALRSDNLSLELAKITGAREHVYTYLADEVIHTLPKALLEFLYATSLVDEFTIPLANHVLEIENAADVIKQLDELNLFLSSSSDEGGSSFRYHQLFADFLHGQLARNEPGRLVVIHSRIAGWYESQGQWVLAIAHYFKANEKKQAVALVDRVSREMYLSGQVRKLEEWYEQVKDDESLVTAAPELLLNLAKSGINRGDYEQSGKLLNLAEAAFIQREDHSNLVNLLVTRGMMFRFIGLYEEGSTLAFKVQALVDEYDLDRYYWYQAERLKGMNAYFLGDPDQALKWLKQAANGLRKMVDRSFDPGQAHELVMTLADIGFIAIAVGDIFETQNSYREALDLARRVRTNFNDVITAHNNYAYLHYLVGNYPEAWKHYLQAFEVAKYNNLGRYIAYIYIGQADVLREIGEWKQAESIYQNAKQQAEKLNDEFAVINALRGLFEVEIEKQDFNAAMFLLREMASIEGVEIEQPAYQSRFARLYLLMGQDSLAKKIFDALDKEGGIDQLSAEDQVVLAMHHAILLARESNEEQSLRALQSAMEKTATLGYDQFVVNLVRKRRDDLDPVMKANGSSQAASILKRANQAPPTLQELVLKEAEDEDERGEIVLNVLALNQGTIRLNGTPLPPRAWSSVGARALFYFILDRKQVSKDEIALTFWPDFSQAKVNSNFHATLWRVRKALGSKTVIEFEDGVYQFSDEVRIYFDVDEFDSLAAEVRQPESSTLRRTAMRRAMELYQTDFLTDIDMPWADARRFELQAQFRDILANLAADYFEKSNPASAVGVYRRAVELDPFQDEYHLRIMQCLVSLGDVQAARDHYRDYVVQLQSEMGIQPDESLGEFINTLK